MPRWPTMDGTDAAWTVVVPLQRAAAAKSRLGGDPARREEVARALARKVVEAVVTCPRVGRVVVVTPDPGDWVELGAVGAELIAEGPGQAQTVALPEGAGARDGRTDADGEASRLNGALDAAAELIGPGPLAVVVGDLPLISANALTTVLDRALAASDAGERGVFVPDATGIGTCMVAYHRRPYAFRFGPDSARQHQALGLLPVTSVDELRVDLDTADDLASTRGAWTDGASGTTNPAT